MSTCVGCVDLVVSACDVCVDLVVSACVCGLGDECM